MKMAAFLRSKQYTQKEIAQRLRIDQSYVSKLLKEALVGGGVDNKPLLKEYVAGEGLGEMDKLEEEIENTNRVVQAIERLAEHGRWRRVPKVKMFEAGSYSDSKRKEWDSAVRRWANDAAPAIYEIIRHCPLIGITWGRQLRACVDGMSRLRLEPRRKPVDVFPLWGQRLSLQRDSDDPLFSNHLELSSNSLSATLFAALNQHIDLNKYNPYKYYLPIPDFIPLDKRISFDNFKEREVENEMNGVSTIMESFRRIEAYSAVFGDDRDDPAALVNQAGAIIASVGPASYRGLWPEHTTYGGIPWMWYENWFLGDLGGVLVARKMEEVKPELRLGYERFRRQFDRVAGHWTGVREEHIRRCANKADGQKQPGVIVLAVGGAKD